MATKEQMADQWWRLNNLYWIIDEQGQKVKFTPNLVQSSLFHSMWFLNIILKSRQHGITTFLCIYFLDSCLFSSNVHAGIIAHNREDAEAFFQDKVQFAYDNLPDFIRNSMKAETESARELAFSNGSSIRVGTSLRSSTNQLLHVSEFGKLCAKFPEKAREVVTGALNTVHQGQKIFIESTAEGKHGYFYDYCQKAKDAKERGVELTPLDFKFFFFAWYDDPKNSLQDNHEVVTINQEMLIYFDGFEKQGIKLTPQQKAWYVLKAEQQGDDMKREHPSTPDEAFEAVAAQCFFLGATDGHNQMRSGQFGNIIKRNGEHEIDFTPQGIVEFWRFPYRLLSDWDRLSWTYRYCIGSDISEGLGGDYSVAYVFDRYFQEFVARMSSNKIDSHRWADKLMDLSRIYDNALIVPERNGAGITTINRLLDRKANLYVREVVAGIGKQVTKQYGWQETKDAKQSICGSLKAYLGAVDDNGKRRHPVYCKTLIGECEVFVKDEEKDSLGAEAGLHDDHVIAAALALAGDFYLPKCEQIIPKPEGWRERIKEKREGKKAVWAA